MNFRCRMTTGAPDPLSLNTRNRYRELNQLSAAFLDIDIDASRPESRLFSTNSFTTEAGLSTTSRQQSGWRAWLAYFECVITTVPATYLFGIISLPNRQADLNADYWLRADAGTLDIHTWPRFCQGFTAHHFVFTDSVCLLN